jgi:hypothetical protein
MYRKFYIALIFSIISLFTLHSQVLVTGSNGANGAYVTLKAAFDAINLQPNQLGNNINVSIFASTAETATARLVGNSTSWMAFNISATANVSIIGNIAGPLVDFDNARNITIDGRLNGNLSAYNLTFENTNTSASSVIRFINGASSNILQHCVLKGASNSLNSATVFFAVGSAASGNSNNIIQANNFLPSIAGRSRINVLSSGSASNYNSHLQIIDNHFANSLMKDEDTTGDVFAVLFAQNTTRSIISRNHFYESGAFGVTDGNGSYSIIDIRGDGEDFRIASNYIGGSEAFCGGAPWSKSQFDNPFTAIKVNATVGGVNNFIQFNSISNINWSNSSNADFTAISSGVRLGATITVEENIIGSALGNNSIQLNNASSSGSFYGIITEGTCVVTRNVIGSITVSNLFNAYATNIIVIQKNAGDVTISDNVIGSKITANSIISTSESTSNTQNIHAINADFTATNIIVTGNIIANIINQSTGNDGTTAGIVIRSTGSTTVEGNEIVHLYNYNNNTSSNHTASLSGIVFVNSTSRHFVRKNSITNLQNKHPFFGGSIFGLYITGTALQQNIVNANFISQLKTESTSSNVYGIYAFSGNTLYSNNIIVLGKNTNARVYGFFDTGSQSQTCNLYHNTIYIDGVFDDDLIPANSYALYSQRNSNIRNYRNNIFLNARTNGLGIARHYAVLFNYTSPGALTLNFNDYLATGAGGTLSRYNNANNNSLPLVPGHDTQSVMIDPLFDNVGGADAQDYGPIASGLNGITIANVLVDYNEKVRATIPTMGAIERLPNKWKGSISNDWAVPGNWTLNVVLFPNDDLIFDANPMNHCVLDADKVVGAVVNAQSNYRVVLNGNKLNVNADLQLTNGAQIDASATASTLEFSGVVAQTIPANALFNNQVYNLTVDNSQNVILNGTLHLLNQLSVVNGRLNAFTQSPILHYSGSSLQNINANQFVNDNVYQLHINNAVGVKLNAPLVVLADMTIETGAKLAVSPAQTLKIDGVTTNNNGALGLVLESDASGTASLIHNSNNVPAIMQRYFDGVAIEWRFISTPVNGQAFDTVWKHTGSYGDGTGYDLYVWDEPSSCWVYNLNTTVDPTWTSVHAGSNFVPGKGYLYATQQLNPVREFEGLLNNGSVSVALSNLGEAPHKGFNLIGNPYASSIDWKAPSGYNRNMLVLNGGGYDIWTWSNTANNYGVYNSADPSNVGTNNVSRYIAPMQAFYVRANVAGNFVFAHAARTHQGASSWRKIPSNVIAAQALSVKISSPEGLGSDEIRIVSGLDMQEPGATKMFSSVPTAPSVYLTYDKKNHSVFYVDAFSKKTNFDLAFKAGKKSKYEFLIEFSDAQFTSVYVYDRKLNKTLALQSGQSFVFDGDVKDDANRFVLYFDENKTQHDVLDVVVSQHNGALGVDLKHAALGVYRCAILDASGRNLKEISIRSGEVKTIPFDQKGVFIINIYNENKQFKTKLVL